MLDGAAPVGFGAVVAGAGFVAGPLMLGGARCLDASRGWCAWLVKRVRYDLCGLDAMFRLPSVFILGR